MHADQRAGMFVGCLIAGVALYMLADVFNSLVNFVVPTELARILIKMLVPGALIGIVALILSD